MMVREQHGSGLGFGVKDLRFTVYGLRFTVMLNLSTSTTHSQSPTGFWGPNVIQMLGFTLPFSGTKPGIGQNQMPPVVGSEEY